MAKGRKSIPTKIIELRGGTAHTHKKPRDQEPQPPVKMPSCPKHLDKEARKEWRRTGKILNSIGLLSDLDRAVLAGYCQWWSEYVSSTIKAHEMGPVYVEGQKKDKDGNILKPGIPKINPHVRLAREAYDRYMKAGVLLGLSPSARASLKVEKPKPKTKAEEFRDRKAGNK